MSANETETFVNRLLTELDSLMLIFYEVTVLKLDLFSDSSFYFCPWGIYANPLDAGGALKQCIFLTNMTKG